MVFQQAADVGISHCALLRHVLSSACQRAGLPAVPSVTPHDITDTALVRHVPAMLYTSARQCHAEMRSAVSNHVTCLVDLLAAALIVSCNSADAAWVWLRHARSVVHNLSGLHPHKQ